MTACFFVIMFMFHVKAQYLLSRFLYLEKTWCDSVLSCAFVSLNMQRVIYNKFPFAP